MSLPVMESWVERLIQQLLKRKKLVCVVLVALCIVMVAGMSRLTFSNDYRLFFSHDNPELQQFTEFQSIFGSTDSIVVVIHDPKGNLFRAPVISSIDKLVNDASKLAYVTHVESITNYQEVTVSDDQLSLAPFFQDAKDMDVSLLQQKKYKAITNPLINGSLLSKNGDTTAVNILFDLPEHDSIAVLDAAKSVRKLANQFRAEHPDLQLALSGIVMLNAAFSEAGIHDLQTLLPCMLLVLMLVLYLMLRSVFATLSIFFIIMLSCGFALGMAGYFSIPLSVVSVSALIIIMTLAVANCMHIVISMLHGMNEKPCAPRDTLVVESLKINFLPVALTSLTTILSFLTLNFSDAPPYWHLGNITAMGVMAAWLLSVLFLPVLLQHIPLSDHISGNAGRQNQRLQTLSLWLISHCRSVVFVGATLSFLLVAAIPLLVFNDQFIHYFSKNIEFRRDAEFMEKHLSGLYSIEYVIPSGRAEGIFDPAYMNRLDDFTGWLKNQDSVNHVYSFSELMKTLNGKLGFDSDNNTQKLLPQDEESAAQQFLMYQLSLSDDDYLETRVSLDKASTRLSVTVDNLSSVELQALVEKADQWQQMHWPEVMRAHATGPAVMFAYISKRNIASMRWGNVVSLVLISLILLVLLRSVALGFLSLVANAMPILMTFGLWAITVNEMGMVGITISAAVIGIVVDDTIHFLTKYLRLRRMMETEVALVTTFKSVGMAMISTSVVLFAGLSVLAASDFQLNQQAGLLTVTCIFFALVFDLLWLPSALYLFDGVFIRSHSKKNDSVDEPGSHVVMVETHPCGVEHKP